MQVLPDSGILDILYKEACTRRHTADQKQADLLAREQAARDSSKLGAESAVLLSNRLHREVHLAFHKHCCRNTELLTKTQLQAVLHDLGLLGNKPAAFSSSSPSRPRAADSPQTARHAHRQAQVVGRLWSCLHTPLANQATFASTNSNHAAYVLTSPDPHGTNTTRLGSEADAAADALLMEGLDMWEQLTGRSHSAASSDSPNDGISLSKQPDPALSTAVHTRVDEAFRAAHSMQSHAAASRQHQAKMTGVTLQQVLSFVQLVQQCNRPASIGSQLLQRPAQEHADELDRLARICSRNKQTNMAYTNIGRSREGRFREGRRPLRSISTNTLDARSTRNIHHARLGALSPSHQPVHAEIKQWRPSGMSSHRSCSPPPVQQHTSSIRYSQRQHRHQLAQQQISTAAAAPMAIARPRSRALSCRSPQPFAASSLTARQVQKLRQAQADAEMEPCTFQPALDPHSLALVANMAVPYKPPHKVNSAHAQDLQPYSCAAASGRQAAACMRISSASDSGSAAEAAALAVPTSSPQAPGGSPHGPDSSHPHGSHGLWAHEQPMQHRHAALTSWECRQQQEMEECTFSPRLNTHARKSKSIVAQAWKEPAGCAKPLQASAALPASSTAGLADSAAAVGPEANGANAGSMSSSHAGNAHHQAACKPLFVTAPMHHEAARARHRQLLSYAATAPPAPSRESTTEPASGSVQGTDGQQQAGNTVGARLSDSDEAELQAALVECDKQQMLLQSRRFGMRQGSGLSVAQRIAAADRPSSSHVVPQHGKAESIQATLEQHPQPVIKIALEAVLPDGSSSRFDVQQGDKLRHLSKYFAAMLDLTGGRDTQSVVACL